MGTVDNDIYMYQYEDLKKISCRINETVFKFYPSSNIIK